MPTQLILVLPPTPFSVLAKDLLLKPAKQPLPYDSQSHTHSLSFSHADNKYSLREALRQNTALVNFLNSCRCNQATSLI